MKVVIANKEHFREAIKFARTHPDRRTRRTFLRCLTTLNRLKRNYGSLHIAPDFVPHSFFWSTPKGLCGGMILHGYGETFSVRLNSTDYPAWQIHT